MWGQVKGFDRRGARRTDTGLDATSQEAGRLPEMISTDFRDSSCLYAVVVDEGGGLLNYEKRWVFIKKTAAC